MSAESGRYLPVNMMVNSEGFNALTAKLEARKAELMKK